MAKQNQLTIINSEQALTIEGHQRQSQQGF